MSTIAVLPPGKDTIDVTNAKFQTVVFKATSGGKIFTDTSDGSDTKAILIGAGGLNGPDRGAGVNMYGNESMANAGLVSVEAGNITGGAVRLYTQGSQPIDCFTNNIARFSIDSSGNFVGRQTTNQIITSTSDGADNATFAIAGGGGVGVTRGAYVLCNGNQTANGGQLLFVAGNEGASQSIVFNTGNTIRWDINNSGLLAATGSLSLQWKTAAATGLILGPSTNDGAVTICGGGSAVNTSGPFMSFSGGASGAATLNTGSTGDFIVNSRGTNSLRCTNTKWGLGSASTVGNEYLTVHSSDDNGIALNSTSLRPTINFQRSSSTKAFICVDGGGFNTGSSDSLFVRAGASGGVYLAPTATGWAAVSDTRKKKGIKTLKSKYVDFSKIETIRFNYINDADTVPERVGFSAQSIQSAYPEIVNVGADSDKTLSLQLDLLLPYIVDTIKDLIKDVAKNTRKAKQLELKIEQLLSVDIPDDA